MRFSESLDRLRFRFYTLRYGEEEAERLLALRGKERAKHLAMLNTFGDRGAARREYARLCETAHSAKVERIEEESRLKALEFRASQFQIEIDAAQTDAEREGYRPQVDLNEKRLEDCRRRLVEARLNEETIAKRVEAERPVEDELPALSEPEATPSRTWPFDDVRASAIAEELASKMRRVTERFYEKIFGRKRCKAILLLDTPGRLKAVEELDLAKVGKHPDTLRIFMIIAREAAVDGLTAKNALVSMVDYVQAIIDDIPVDTDDPDLQQKAAKAQRLLESLNPVIAEASRRVDEYKDAVSILEMRVRNAVERRSDVQR